MLKTASILTGSVVGLFLSCQAQAFPTAPAQAPDVVVQVRGFCGLGFHRGPYGACVPNGAYYAPGVVVEPAPVVVAPRAVVVAPAPVVVAPRLCPYGYTYAPAVNACIPL